MSCLQRDPLLSDRFVDIINALFNAMALALPNFSLLCHSQACTNIKCHFGCDIGSCKYIRSSEKHGEVFNLILLRVHLFKIMTMTIGGPLN